MKVLLFIAFAAVMVYVYSQEVVPVICPDPTDGNVTFVGNPCNCSSYYVCFAGGKIAMPCPPGLHFNTTVNVCDWPWNANCTVDPRCYQ